MEYTIEWGGDPEDVRFTTSGVASVAGLDAALREAMADERWTHGMNILLDHRNLDLTGLGPLEVESRALLLQREADAIGAQRVAFVAGNAVGYGIARSLAAYLDERVPFVASAFTSIEDARDWLRGESVHHEPVQPSA